MPSLPSGWPFWLFSIIIIIGVPWILLQAPDEDVTLPPLPIQTDIAMENALQPESFFAAPLFVEGRILMPIVDTSIEDRATDESNSEVIASKPILVGLIANGRGKSAAVLKGADNSQKTLKTKEIIDGWRLTSIGRKSVTLVQNGESITLTLQFPEAKFGDRTAPNSTSNDQRIVTSLTPPDKVQPSQQTEDNQ